MSKHSLSLVFLMGFLLCGFVESQRLQQYNIDPNSVTVSGLSAGGAMAMQFHFAHSSEVHGAGIFAGLAYLCASAGLMAANMCMISPLITNVNNLIAQATNLGASGQIDPVGHIRGDRVFIFHGAMDFTVVPGAGRHVETMYNHFGAQITPQFSLPSGHAFPTHNFGGNCGSTASPFINNCNFRGAFEMLNFLYGGGLTLPADTAGVAGNLLNYDQLEFVAGTPNLSSMNAQGFVYVPTACQQGASCRLHISFHGCLQARQNVGNAYAANAGFMQVAEVNNIIVLFPQASSIFLTNPNACFDWWGYLNSNFATRNGAQIAATYRMMNRLIRG